MYDIDNMTTPDSHVPLVYDMAIPNLLPSSQKDDLGVGGIEWHAELRFHLVPRVPGIILLYILSLIHI